MSYSQSLIFSADHLAVFRSQPTNIGNPGDTGFGMSVHQATAAGGPDDLYRLVWYQNTNSNDATFRNGQMWRIESYNSAADADGDPTTSDAGWDDLLFTNLIPKNDLVAGMGSGQDYIVFENQESGGFLMLDMNRTFGPDATDLFYSGPKTPDMRFDSVTYVKPMICFTHGTVIATPNGPRRIETLSVGDLVETDANGPQPIRWIGSRRVPTQGDAARHLRPIRIARDALGAGRPTSDLVVSPQHRIVVTSALSVEMFGTARILVAAKQLLAVDGVSVEPPSTAVHYIHILLDRHEIVLANGAQTETLYLGPQALNAMGEAGRKEILELFPELADGVPPPLALLVPKGGQARRLAGRHARKGLPLLDMSL